MFYSSALYILNPALGQTIIGVKLDITIEEGAFTLEF